MSDTIISVPFFDFAIKSFIFFYNLYPIFEGFLDSSITAIDERDRVTSGHSRRVMGYCLAFAEAMNRVQNGMAGPEPFPADRMRQFKFSALLHDIGESLGPFNHGEVIASILKPFICRDAEPASILIRSALASLISN